MDDFEFSVHGELFRVNEETHPDRVGTYQFGWLNGPAEGTYGFSIGRFAGGAASPGDDIHPRMSQTQLIAEARSFVESFYAPGGIGEEDFPEHVAERRPEPHLRAWRASDAAALVEASHSSPDVAVQLGTPDLTTEALARDFIAHDLAQTDTRLNWAIVEDSVAVGNAGMSRIDRNHNTAWLHYWLAASARGKGLATRALVSVADWAFSDGLFRLELGHRVNNPASCRVATRAGFVAEGIERQKLRYGTERFDVELHARLQSDDAPDIRALPLMH
ncbi:hypothetical protein NYA9BBAC_00432 [Salinibacterium sp. NYA9b]